MIKNDKQYSVTKSRLKEFKESLTNLEKEKIDPLLKTLHKNALESQINEFENLLTEYEQLKNGSQKYVIVDKLSNFYEVLIKGRIAKRWTHADLANKLNLKEQQIQRYESCNYTTASMDRIVEVANALNISITGIKVHVNDQKFLMPEGVNGQMLSIIQQRKYLMKIANS